VVDALLNAVHNGKRVLAVVELAARFDEQANINWAQRLTEGGIEVLFGIPGLKVHSKLLLVQRREDGQKRYYSHIGTGNFNERTARLYTDFSLLTYDQEARPRGQPTCLIFCKYTYRRHDYEQLLVSPHSSRPGLMRMLDREIANARRGLRAAVTLKCNNLVDREVVHEALRGERRQGVECGSSCAACARCSPASRASPTTSRPSASSIATWSTRASTSFYNAGDPEYYIGSADLMTRNLDYRVEVLCPVRHDRRGQGDMLQSVLDIQWHDNVKARILDREPEQRTWCRARPNRSLTIRSQEVIHSYLVERQAAAACRARTCRLPPKRRKSRAAESRRSDPDGRCQSARAPRRHRRSPGRRVGHDQGGRQARPPACWATIWR
jgi:polyphosphate kinase